MATWLRTLKDVLDTGQEMVAVCHNPACRFHRMVDIEAVIRHVGASHQLVPVRGVPHFSERMRCPLCGQKVMFVWIKEPKLPVPWFGDAKQCEVRLWDDGSNKLEQVLAKASRTELGVAAFEQAVRLYPGRRVTLQEGALVIRDSRFDVLRGGKRFA